MAGENELNGDLRRNHETPSSNSEVKQVGNKKTGSVPFYKLFSFADSFDGYLMIMGSAGALGNGAFFPLMTVLLANSIQSFGGAKDDHDVVERVSKVALEFVCLGIGSGVASFLQVSCWMSTGERQAARIRNLYLKTLLRQDIAFFDTETNSGEVIERMTGDTVLIQQAMGEKVGKFIQLISTFISGLVVAFVKGWQLTLVILSIIPLLVLSAATMSIVVYRMASKVQKANGDAAVIVEEAVGSIRTVASFTGERLLVNKYKNAITNACNYSVNEGLTVGFCFSFIMFSMFSVYSLGLWYGGKMILDERKGYTGADVVNVIFAVISGSVSLGQASPCLTAFASGQAAAYKMFETINRKPEIDARDTSAKKLHNIHGDIEFRDVYFSYPVRSNEQIFRGFSLLINSGTTVALVGESGSGKSTVINLIERFYDPQAGEVLIDGTNIKYLQLGWLRGKIGLVSQEPVLFTSSIKDNISYGKENATNEEIRIAVELANASKFIDKMPKGLNTMVGEHGTQLSGGQKQRIAIARAILKEPKILLLDEATSSLDSESERVVQEALDRVMLNRTTVIVAHRLSTVRNAKTIYVIHHGSIVEKGSHVELTKDPNGAYNQLIQLQEMDKISNPMSQFDNEKSSLSVDETRRSSQRKSFRKSISRESLLGSSSRHRTFSADLDLSVEINVLERFSPKQLKEVPLARLASFNKPELSILLLGTTFAILQGLVFPVFGVLLSSAINTFYQPPHKLKKYSNFWSLMFLIFGVFSLVALPARTYFFGVAGSRLVRRIRLMTFEKVMNMEIEWFDEPKNSSGTIGARLSTDAAVVRVIVGDVLSLIVQNISTLIAGLVIAFIANWQLSLIILAMIPLLGLNGWIQVKVLNGFSADAKMMYKDASQVANDAVGNIRTVASFSAEEKVMELYRKKCEGSIRTGIKQGVVSGIGFGASYFMLFCAYATIFYVGAHLVEDGKATFGEVFRVFFTLTLATLCISLSSSLAPDYSKAKFATASVFSILDQKSKIDPSDDSGMTLDSLKGDIEFHNVSFKYLTRPDVQIFQNLCLSIKSGKVIALVGESGSGKSTTISLLQRFYDPDSGHILLDGIKLQKFKLRWLRQQMGLVSQEPVLFNDTIRANIAYGKEGEATEAEIVAAAEAANAHMFICSLQQGYDTIVGERGIQLSGGQKQRVAISRAIVKNPKILLLDEATSALDAESERIVQDALDIVMINRTTLVVSHRLTTICSADLIAVIKNGVIIEKGKHDTLVNIKDGAYASLVALQSSSTNS